MTAWQDLSVAQENWLQVVSGVRQGSLLSPLPFIVYVDWVMGYFVVENQETTSAYADEVALVTHSVHKFQDAADKWKIVMEENSMKISREK